MQYRFVKLASIAASILVFATPSIAGQDNSSASRHTPQSAAATQASAKSKPNAPTQAKLVDINSASRTELKRLAGIGDTEADKIIGGRPYLSKADLVTRGIVSAGVYESIKKQVMAKPKSH